jgi:sialic acid synthase SpsE
MFTIRNRSVLGSSDIFRQAEIDMNYAEKMEENRKRIEAAKRANRSPSPLVRMMAEKF